MPKFLIVNADDLGISRATNLAIATAHHHGILTSASLMANMPAARHAVEDVVAAAPRLGVGLHLCLTSGRPVLAPARVPLLIDCWGNFKHSFVGLLRMLCSQRGEEALVQVRRELVAQARFAERLGVRIDHVNGHQHIHMLPGVFAVAAQIAQSRGVAVRIPHSPLTRGERGPLATLKWFASGGLVKRAILARLSRQALQSPLTVSRVDHCYGVIETGRLTAPALHALLASLPEGTSEVFTHPSLDDVACDAGYEIACSPADHGFLKSRLRAAELAALVDPALPELIEHYGITLATFGDLRKNAPMKVGQACEAA